MTSPHEYDYNIELTKQLTESLQAIASLTQSMHSLQEQVSDHSNLIIESKTDLLVLKDRLSTIVRLVQGEGLKDSMTAAIIELQTKINALEQWKKDSHTDRVGSKSTNITITVLIVSAISTILATIFSTVIPMLLQKGP